MLVYNGDKHFLVYGGLKYTTETNSFWLMVALSIMGSFVGSFTTQSAKMIDDHIFGDTQFTETLMCLITLSIQINTTIVCDSLQWLEIPNNITEDFTGPLMDRPKIYCMEVKS